MLWQQANLLAIGLNVLDHALELADAPDGGQWFGQLCGADIEHLMLAERDAAAFAGGAGGRARGAAGD